IGETIGGAEVHSCKGTAQLRSKENDACRLHFLMADGQSSDFSPPIGAILRVPNAFGSNWFGDYEEYEILEVDPHIQGSRGRNFTAKKLPELPEECDCRETESPSRLLLDGRELATGSLKLEANGREGWFMPDSASLVRCALSQTMYPTLVADLGSHQH